MEIEYFDIVAGVISILLYGCTTWMLTKQLEKKLDGNYTRMLRAILNKSWRQHPTKHQLYGHLPPIMKTIQVRWTGHAGHCWRSRDELISDVLLWTPTYGRAKAGWLARIYIQQLCEDTGCSPEDLPEAMNDTEKWRDRVRDICARSQTWWWWCVCVCVCACVRARTFLSTTLLPWWNEDWVLIIFYLNSILRWDLALKVLKVYYSVTTVNCICIYLALWTHLNYVLYCLLTKGFCYILLA